MWQWRCVASLGARLWDWQVWTDGSFVTMNNERIPLAGSEPAVWFEYILRLGPVYPLEVRAPHHSRWTLHSRFMPAYQVYHQHTMSLHVLSGRPCPWGGEGLDAWHCCSPTESSISARCSLARVQPPTTECSQARPMRPLQTCTGRLLLAASSKQPWVLCIPTHLKSFQTNHLNGGRVRELEHRNILPQFSNSLVWKAYLRHIYVHLRSRNTGPHSSWPCAWLHYPIPGAGPCMRNARGANRPKQS